MLPTHTINRCSLFRTTARTTTVFPLGLGLKKLLKKLDHSTIPRLRAPTRHTCMTSAGNTPVTLYGPPCLRWILLPVYFYPRRAQFFNSPCADWCLQSDAVSDRHLFAWALIHRQASRWCGPTARTSRCPRYATFTCWLVCDGFWLVFDGVWLFQSASASLLPGANSQAEHCVVVSATRFIKRERNSC